MSRHGGGSAYSGLRGNISTNFLDGTDDRGASGGKAYIDGFDHGTPYRYGYPTTETTQHSHEIYHSIFNDKACHALSECHPINQ